MTLHLHRNPTAAAQHRARQAMERDIAQYRSENDLFELLDIIERYPDEQTRDLRRIVTRRLAQV